ncbi:MAG TPA: PhoU domain-containing protein [Acidimicrobiales bacterium]|nr:PhoU domain-containing protein [Acidimicrobiales bacterium]
MAHDGGQSRLDREVTHLFSLVSEALAGATDALLAAEPAAASRVVAADELVDTMTAQLSSRIWEDFDRLAPASPRLRHLVGLLAVLPELERSADLAAHIAQRAVTHLGPSMSPGSRGIVQRMSDVALEMWGAVAASYVNRTAAGTALDEADEELDILLERLTSEVASSAMPAQVAAQVTLLGRFYERLGDHAVNLARRIELLPGVNGDDSKD